MKKDPFLPRVVHSDGKGIFVYYGGCRFRPIRNRRTRTTVGMTVQLNPKPHESPVTRKTFLCAHHGHVLVNDQKETWSCGLKWKREVPEWYKNRHRR